MWKGTIIYSKASFQLPLPGHLRTSLAVSQPSLTTLLSSARCLPDSLRLPFRWLLLCIPAAHFNHIYLWSCCAPGLCPDPFLSHTQPLLGCLNQMAPLVASLAQVCLNFRFTSSPLVDFFPCVWQTCTLSSMFPAHTQSVLTSLLLLPSPISAEIPPSTEFPGRSPGASPITCQSPGLVNSLSSMPTRTTTSHSAPGTWIQSTVTSCRDHCLYLLNQLPKLQLQPILHSAVTGNFLRWKPGLVILF